MTTNRAGEESKLINQGTYGCIYYPSLPFQLRRDKKNRKHPHAENADDQQRSKYVSKLQKHNFHSEFEDYIGKKIQEIPSFELFFVPILKTHKIDLATIKQSYVTECNAIKDVRRNIQGTGSSSKRDHDRVSEAEYNVLNKKFIVQKMKYIKGVYLHSYVSEIGAQGADDRDHNSSGSGSDDDRDDDPKSYVSRTLKKDKRQIE
jgi:hypothetical protein